MPSPSTSPPRPSSAQRPGGVASGSAADQAGLRAPIGAPPQALKPAREPLTPARKRALGAVAATVLVLLMVVGWMNGPGKPVYEPRVPVAYVALPDAFPKSLAVKEVRPGGLIMLADPTGRLEQLTLEHVLIPASRDCLYAESADYLETLLPVGATVAGGETGELTVEGTLVAAELVRAGLAVPHPAGAETDPEYREVLAAQEAARAAQAGFYSPSIACTVPTRVAAYAALTAGLSSEADAALEAAITRTNERVEAENLRLEQEAAAAAVAATAAAEREAAAAAPAPEPASLEPRNTPGPDLDCSDIGMKVWISGIDYHRLDADGDGWGCDSYG